MTGLELSDDARLFWTERHLASLSTVRPDGSIHVVAVGVTVDFETGIARVITSGTSVKARRIGRAGEVGLQAAVFQVDGRRWGSLEGTARLRTDPGSVADAERRYAQRYRPPRENPRRVVVEITVERVLGLR